MPSTPNDSSTGGYLRPTTAAPTDDLDLDGQIQALIVGITGLKGERVLPRWQEEDVNDPETAPRIPGIRENWCAVGVIETAKSEQPAQIHRGSGLGTTILIRHEVFSVLASFYGPRGNAYAELFRDGLSIAQNREALYHQNMNLVDADAIRRIPEFTNTQRRRRSDLAFRLRRSVRRVYPIRNLIKADGSFVTESHTTEW